MILDCGLIFLQIKQAEVGNRFNLLIIILMNNFQLMEAVEEMTLFHQQVMVMFGFIMKIDGEKPNLIFILMELGILQLLISSMELLGKNARIKRRVKNGNKRKRHYR